MTDGSLRAQLVGWLLVPLGVLWAADAVGTWYSALATVNAAYDRAVYASVLAITERVKVQDGKPGVDIPPVALEVLDTPEQERIYYRIGYRIGDGPEAFLTGYADLPGPPSGPRGRPVFYEAVFHGYPIRLCALETRFPTAPPITVVVQSAETVAGRGRLHRAIVGRELAVALGGIMIAAVLAWFAVTRGLRPVRALSEEVAHRSATDLSPVALERVPGELAPVVAAVNDLMRRMRTAIAAQRRFIADASHALRTPLAVLRTQADVALREEDPAALRAAVAQLRDQSVAAGRLAAQLLALARVGHRAGPADHERLDLEALARETCAALVPEALRRDVDLGFDGSGRALVRGRAHDLREAVVNLVENALRHGGAGGRVTVSVTRPAPGIAALAVEDDGPGIPARDRDRVLQPFHRLPGSAGDGAGLGLAIVQEIATGHGAELRLGEAAGGHGLRVELLLPLDAEA